MFDKLTVRRFVQPLKAIVLNVVTLSGSVTSVSEVQFWKPPAPIYVIASVKPTLTKLLHPLKK